MGRVRSYRLGWSLSVLFCLLLWSAGRAQVVEPVDEAEALSGAGRKFNHEFRPEAPLSLPEALTQAILLHPALKEALARVEADEFAVRASTAPLYPEFSFSAATSQSGTTGQPGGLDVVRTGLSRSYGYGISLSQQIFDFGRTRHTIRLSELQLGVTRLNYLQVRQTVLNQVVQAYFDLLRQDQAITVGLENVRNAQAVLEQAQGFLEAGTGPKIDVIQAEANLANARFDLVQAQGGYGRARAALAQAMGLDELPEVELEETYLEAPEWRVAAVRKYAQTLRPEVAGASLQVAQAETQIRLAKADYYPRISLGAGYNWNDQTFPPMNTSYNVGLSLSVPLINEPLLSSNVGAAEARYDAALAGFRAVELQVVQEAVASFYTLQEALGRSEAAVEALRAATENYRLAVERYKVGVGNSIEVSNAQQQLVQARSQELQARFDVQTAIAELLRNTGQLDARALLPPDLVIDPIFELPERVVPPEAR